MNTAGQASVEILLVEDNPDDVQLTMRTFRKQRISERIEVLRDGAEALDFLFCEGSYARRSPCTPPRLIVLDLKLPKINGLEVLARLKQDSRTNRIPVVILSSSQEDRDICEAYRQGVNSYVVKPVDSERFSEALRTVASYWLMFNRQPSS